LADGGPGGTDPDVICPKCGFEQADGGIDCPRCGIVFSRYRGAVPVPAPAATPGPMHGVAPRPAPAAAPEPLRGMAPEPFRAAASGAAQTAATTPPAATLYGGGGGADGPVGAAEPAVVGVAMRPVSSAVPGGGSGFASGYRQQSANPGNRAASAAPAIGAAGSGPPFRVGEVLGDVFSVFFDNLLPFILIAALVTAPLFVLLTIMSASRSREAVIAAGVIVLIQWVALTPLVTGAVTFGVVQELRGREASIGECLSRGLSSLGKIFVTALLQSLAVGLGSLLCLVPGLIAAAAFSVAVPAVLEEPSGAADALRRSADLTRGHRVEVFVVLLAIGIIQFGLGKALALVMPASGKTLIAAMLPSLALSPLSTSLAATAAAVMYYRLRSSKEGIDVAAITSVFD
jgi:hypothetical protein